MAKNPCIGCIETKQIANKLKYIQPGALLNNIYSTSTEQCERYLDAMRAAKVLTPYSSVALSDNSKLIENQRDIKKLPLGPYNIELFSAIREQLTLDQKSNDSKLCQSFESKKQSMIARGETHIKATNTQSQKEIAKRIDVNKSKRASIAIAALAEVMQQRELDDYIRNRALRDPAATNLLSRGQYRVAVRDGTEVKLNIQDDISPYMRAIKQEIDLVKSHYQRVNDHINKTTRELNFLKSQNRILAVESNVIDHTGKITPHIQTAFLEVPAGIDVTKIANLPAAEKNAIYERIRSESKPITPMDPERLKESGITSDDLKVYNDILKLVGDLGSDPDVMLGFYSTPEVISQLKLSDDANDINARLRRVASGNPTEQDLESISEGYFTKELKRLGTEIYSEPGAMKALGKFAYNATVGGYTNYIQAGEYATHLAGSRLGTWYSKKLLQELRNAVTVGEWNASAAVRQGLVSRLSGPPGQYVPNVIANRVSNIATPLKHGLEHFSEHAFHNLGQFLPAIGAGLYTAEAYQYLSKANKCLKSGETAKARLYQEKAEKAAVMAGVETLGFFGLLGGWPAVFVAAGVGGMYTWNTYALESADFYNEQERAKAIARTGNMNENAYALGLAIPNDAYATAASQANDDPLDDIFLQRNDDPTQIDPVSINYNKVLTPRVDELFPIIPLGLFGRIRVPIPAKVTKYEKIEQIPYNVIDRKGSLIFDKSGEPLNDEEARKKREEVDRQCCGFIDPYGNVLEQIELWANNSGTSNCKSIFTYYGAQVAKAKTGNVVADGIKYLCLGYGACFTSDVKVLTPTGEINIDKIKIGDSVIAFDKNGNLTESSVTETFVHEGMLFFEYTFNNGVKINSTPNHPFYTKNGFVEIGNINIGENVIDVDGKEIKLISAEKKYNSNVYNIEVKDHHTYIANGLRVHNKFDPNAVKDWFVDYQPTPVPKHNARVPWPDPTSDTDANGNPVVGWTSIFEESPMKWKLTYNCEVTKTNRKKAGDTDPRDNPLGPKPIYTWTCEYVIQTARNPIETGFHDIDPRNLPPELWGLTDSQVKLDDISIPIPPIQRQSTTNPYQAPPHTYVAQPGNPNFPWQMSNIDVYLKGFPFFFNEKDITMIKSCDYKSIKDYFTLNTDIYGNKRSEIAIYHILEIAYALCNEKQKEDRNEDEKEKYKDCILSTEG